LRWSRKVFFEVMTPTSDLNDREEMARGRARREVKAKGNCEDLGWNVA
jgi:hypothetical protein